MNVVVATCRAMPDVQPDDVGFVAALRAAGCDVSAAPWNGPFAPFAAADVVAVRSPWDYAASPGAFLDWLRELEGARAVTGNSCPLMRWNARKSYLLELAARGAPLPPTVAVRADVGEIAAAAAAIGGDAVVVKPLFGAGASGLTIARLDEPATLTDAAARLGGDGVVQPLIPEIRTRGEVSLTFFGGVYSHAAVKRPRQGSILVQSEHGGSVAPFAPDRAAQQAARAVLALLPETPLYARVDLVLTDRGPLLMEVELIEPELFLRCGDGAAARYAELVLAQARG